MTTITASLNIMRDILLGPIAKSVESSVVTAQAQASVDEVIATVNRARHPRGSFFNETVNTTQDGPDSAACQIAIHLPFVRI